MKKQGKINTVLLGCGEITKHYGYSLFNSDTIELIGVCDKDEHAAGRHSFMDVPFFTDYSQISPENTDLVILATTAESHFSIAEKLIRQRIPVLTEKPMTGSVSETETLFRLSSEYNSKVDCMFHWKYLPEIDYLKDNMGKYGKLKKIKLFIHDNYACMNNSIRADRRGMMGAWIDSGINALSLIDEILPLNSGTVFKAEESLEYDSFTGYTIYADKKYRISDVDVEIIVDWRENTRIKTFEFEFEKNKVTIFHSQKEYYVDDKLEFTWESDDALADQYTRIFKNYSIDNADTANILTLHKILFL